VVAGFQKCGTTYLQNKILYPSKRLFIPHHETHFLQNDKYEQFVAEFDNVSKGNKDDEILISGYKSPFELGHGRSLRNLEALFPDVQMILTLRHPVLQFQSLYNYKLRTLPETVPPVEAFVGICGDLCRKEESSSLGQHCLTDVHFCTGGSNYHQYLSRLGFTPMNTPEELDLLDHHQMSIHNFSGTGKTEDRKGNARGGRDSDDSSSVGRNKNSIGENKNRGRLFLIEIGQFDNRVNQTMADDVASDLESFLGLDEGDLPRALHRNGDKKPKPVYEYPEDRKDRVLDICLEKYKPLRQVLLNTSRQASEWIMKYLLHPSNRDKVVVSNIDIFERMLNEWKIDPCSEKDDASI